MLLNFALFKAEVYAAISIELQLRARGRINVAIAAIGLLRYAKVDMDDRSR
jgi:hypothetical protein